MEQAHKENLKEEREDNMHKPTFQKAQRLKVKASILIDGLSGTGKSGLALALAKGLAGDWKKVAALDTENRSLPLYVGTKLHTGDKVEEFAVGYLTPDDDFRPSYYKAYQDLAVKQGFEVMICDSISHMWQYKGGMLEMVTEAQTQNDRLNNYTAWNVPEIRKEKNIIMDLVRHPKIHCINTVRVKEKMEFVEGDDGKKALRSLGDQQIVMPNMKYEPDLVLSMISPGTADGVPPKVRVTKSRYAPFQTDTEYEITPELIEQLRVYLDEGADPEDLIKAQQKAFLDEVKEYFKKNPKRVGVFNILLENNGKKGVALEDIPMRELKEIFAKLVG